MDPIRTYWPNGQIRCEEYENERGESHSDNGPAACMWYESGQIKYERYTINNQLHNDNGPARCWWYESGQMEYREYYVFGRPHNDNGPASYRWYESGQIMCVEYYVNGRRHNANGPAICWYSIYGRPFSEYYYLDDKGLYKDQWRDRTKPAEIMRVISLLPYPIAEEVGHYYCVA